MTVNTYVDPEREQFEAFKKLPPDEPIMMLNMIRFRSKAVYEDFRDALGKLRGDVIAGASYFSNWYQVWIGAGYSAGNDFAPLRHLWSLAVEEQFERFLKSDLLVLGE